MVIGIYTGRDEENRPTFKIIWRDKNEIHCSHHHRTESTLSERRENRIDHTKRKRERPDLCRGRHLLGCDPGNNHFRRSRKRDPGGERHRMRKLFLAVFGLLYLPIVVISELTKVYKK